MKLPNSQPVDPALVARIVDYVGRERLAKSLYIAPEQVDHWAVHGIEAGPAAACFRYLAAELSLPTTAVGACVLCGANATEMIATTPVCAPCCRPTAEKVGQVGMGYWEKYQLAEGGNQVLTYVAVSATQSFERPMFVTFKAQSSVSRKKDPEVGDEIFDAAVWLETDDYEAVFETFQLLRRRQLVYNLTRTGFVRIDVNDVVWEPNIWVASNDLVPIHLVLLGWSLLYETSNAWEF